MAFFPASHSEAGAWLNYFVQSQDGLDATKTTQVYAMDTTLRFASYPATQGANVIAELVTLRFAKLDVIRHVPKYFDLVGSRLWAVFDITYRVKGDPAVEDFSVPCACMFSIVKEGAEKGKIKELGIYMDQTMVEKRMEEVSRE
ncbi:hypothetical protein B0T10DRAFT_490625 [Thelonectria olida]|uniref:Uncharacterized protein n=1 Tax=Thelonectria olida TaxID=1576542 RepID=A0A9P8W1Q4_9HYPO|nr:hypothetical protein B0T10DRAFT_490625 [Thelonectria olida]